MYTASCTHISTDLNWTGVLYGFEMDVYLLFLCKMKAMTMASATAATARTRKKTDTDTHTGNVLSESDASESGDEPTHAVLVAVPTVLTIAVSVTVITCITVTTCTPEEVDALLLVPGDRKRKVKLNKVNENTLTIRKLQHYMHVWVFNRLVHGYCMLF